MPSAPDILARLVYLLADTSLNYKRSPWSQAQGPLGWINLVRGELDELEVEVKAGNYDNVEDEFGDVIWCVASLALAVRATGKVLVSNAMTRSLTKMRARKPWIFDGSVIEFTAEEEHNNFRKNKEELNLAVRKLSE